MTGRARLALALVLLALAPSGCALAGRSLSVYVDDKLMKSGVKRRLASGQSGEPGVRVDTFDGTVYLSGTVDTAAEKADAERLASEVGGVQQIVNDLVVLEVEVSAMPRAAPPHPLISRLSGVARVGPDRPGGPELAYDFGGRVVASVYTISWRDLINMGFTSLLPAGRPVDHVSTYALPESADLPGPAYAIVLWHVSEQEAAALR